RSVAVQTSLASLPETARSTASPERSMFSVCCGSKQFTQQLAVLQEEKITSGTSFSSTLPSPLSSVRLATAGVMVTLDQSLILLPPFQAHFVFGVNDVAAGQCGKLGGRPMAVTSMRALPQPPVCNVNEATTAAALE